MEEYQVELTSDLVEKTMEILNEKGWCRGTYRNGYTGARCTMGAFAEAVGADNISRLEVSPVAAELAKLVGAPPRHGEWVDAHGVKFIGYRHEITNWNDDDEMTKDRVIDALMDAAKTLRNEGR